METSQSGFRNFPLGYSPVGIDIRPLVLKRWIRMEYVSISSFGVLLLIRSTDGIANGSLILAIPISQSLNRVFTTFLWIVIPDLVCSPKQQLLLAANRWNINAKSNASPSSYFSLHLAFDFFQNEASNLCNTYAGFYSQYTNDRFH